MPRKAISSSIRMSKLRPTMCLLILLPLLVPFDVIAKGKTTRVSVSSTGEQGNANSYPPSISIDGRYIAFKSWADNLVDGDTNNADDIFVHDRQTGLTARVSVSSTGVQGNSMSHHQSISSDGRYVAFISWADNLVDGDSNGSRDVFVHDRQTGQTELVSVSSTGVQGNDRSVEPSISPNGRYVAFISLADNLVDGDSNGSRDVFVHDRQTGQTELVSVSSTGEQGNANSYTFTDKPSITFDGRYIAYNSWATNLVDGDSNEFIDIFVHDRQTGQTELVSVSSTGEQGNHLSYDQSISFDGRYVAFISWADNLVDGDSNGSRDAFVHDRLTGQTELVSVSSTGVQGDDSSYSPSISSYGQFVAFSSSADNLVDGDTNLYYDVFVHDQLPKSVEQIPRYRLYNPYTYHHHYTTDANEYNVLKTLGWIQEGTGCYFYNGYYVIDDVETVRYYRLYNPYSYEHHWTTDANEYKVLGTIGWIREGADGYVFATQVSGSEPLYRLYNPNDGFHHWTMDTNERSVLIGYGFIDEGIACYVFP